MSFLTVIEQDATDVENALVSGGKALITYVDNVVVTDIIPALETQLLAAIEKLGQEAVAALLGTALGNATLSAATPATPASPSPASS